MNSPLKPPDPVKYFVGLLVNSTRLVDKTIKDMESYFGPHDFLSEAFDFNVTDYYEEEMGSDLKRLFVSFDRLIGAEKIVEMKLKTDEIEDRYRENGLRRVNIDPGYIDFYKVVLASHKYGGQKIYLGEMVYADFTLYYWKKNFAAFEWTFPDFKDARYYLTLKCIREIYRKQIRER